jgi:hypothetical protein
LHISHFRPHFKQITHKIETKNYITRKLRIQSLIQLFPTVERFIGQLKGTITSSRHQMEQAARNFIQQHHTGPFLDTTNFCEEALQCLRRSGCTADFFTTFTVHHITYLTEGRAKVPVQGEAALLTFICSTLMLPQDIEQHRVARLVRYNVTLTSTSAISSGIGRENAKTNDTFIRVNENHFGEIADILELPSEEKFLIVLRKFEKTIVLDDIGMTLLLPRNHYPFRKTADYFVFELSRSVFIQKGFYCTLTYKNQTALFPCLSFRPNDWFSF